MNISTKLKFEFIRSYMLKNRSYSFSNKYVNAGIQFLLFLKPYYPEYYR